MMERKKAPLQLHLVHYHKALKKFLASQSYLSEIDFIDIEIPQVINDIKDFEKIITTQKEKDCLEKLSDDYIPIWLSSSKEYLIWLQKRKTFLEKPVKVQAFSWTGSSEQLEKLHDGLIYYGFIDAKTDSQSFAAIFSGQVIDNNLLPVTWIKKTHKSKVIAKSAVVNLFESLAEKNLIPADELQNKAEFFRKLQACFSDPAPAGNSMKFEHKHLGYSKEFATLLRQIVTSL